MPLILEGNSWAVKVDGRILHAFNAADGSSLSGALAIYSHGHVYGTTAIGGVGPGCGTNSACGTVYELSPSGSGFTESVVCTFGNGADGGGPQGGVVVDSAGNLYGTILYAGGGNGCGTVFRLSPNLSGGWTKNVLHNFDSSFGDGCFPYGGLAFDSAGNLYGTTASGGTNDTGAVFQLTPTLMNWELQRDLQLSTRRKRRRCEPTWNSCPRQRRQFVSHNLKWGIYNAGTVFEITPAKWGMD